MNKILLSLVGLMSFYSSFAENLTGSPDSIYTSACSLTSYLPINKPRTTEIGLMIFDNNNNLLVANDGRGGGLSSYDGATWSYWDETNGLASNWVYSLFKDREGKTWAGTDSGVSVYDGVSWNNYPCTNNIITSLCEDKKGSIWLFGTTSFIFTNNKIVHKSIPFTGLFNACVFDKDSNMWVATSNGIWKYDGVFWNKFSTLQGLCQNSVANIKLIHDTLYCLYDNLFKDSISRFDGSRWVPFKSPCYQGYGISSISEDINHNIWILERSGRLYKYSAGNWKFIDVSANLSNYWRTTAITSDLMGNFWIGSARGVAKLEGNNFTYTTNYLDKGIGSLNTFSPIFDRKNNLWVGGSTSLSKFDGEKWDYFSIDSIISGVIDLRTLTQDTNGSIYAYSGNVFYKYEAEQWINYGYELYSAYGLPYYTQYNHVIFDKMNNMWYANENNLIVRFDGENLTYFGSQDGILIDNAAQKIVEDKSGNIWVLYFALNKLLKYDGKSWSVFTIPISGNIITDIAFDAKGTLWLGSSVGLIKYDSIAGFEYYNTMNSNIMYNNIVGTGVDQNNNIYMFYGQEGAFSVFSNNTFKNYHLKDYEKIFINSIVADTMGEVFISTYYSGLLKLKLNLSSPGVTLTNTNCVGVDNGTITIHPADTGYLYSIDNGMHFNSDTSYNKLPAGNYNIIVKNASCYSYPVPVILTKPEGNFNVEIGNATCSNRNDGFIRVISSGLDSIYLNWSNGKDSSYIDSLFKGKYSVEVSFKNNCQFTREYEIKVPDSLKLKADILNECGSYTGKIRLDISGGIRPYKILWSSDDTTAALDNLIKGSYHVIIQDSTYCYNIDSTFTIKSFESISQNRIIGEREKYLCSNSVSLSTKDDFLSYKWFRNDTILVDKDSNSINISNPGIYKVEVIDSNYCYGSDSLQIIGRKVYSTPQICLVTVNENNKNEIIWNVFPADSLVELHILKESNIGNVYNELKTIPAYSQGRYIDTASSPETKSDRYKMYLVNECGSNSDTGNVHKTIHLSSNTGTHGEVNLSWNAYEGFNYGSYNIYRGTSPLSFNLLTSIQSTLDSYTDVDPPNGNNVYYQIEVINQDNCTPDESKFHKSAYSSRSNVIFNTITTVDALYISSIIISPNPVIETFTISSIKNNGKPYKIVIMDVSGKIVFTKQFSLDNITIDRGTISSGLYFIAIEGSGFYYNAKIVFE